MRRHLSLITLSCILCLGPRPVWAEDPPAPAAPQPDAEAAAGYDGLVGTEPGRRGELLTRRLEAGDLAGLQDAAARLEARRGSLSAREAAFYRQLLDAVAAQKNKLLDPKNPGDPERLAALAGFHDRLLGIKPETAEGPDATEEVGGEPSGPDRPDRPEGPGAVDMKPAAGAVKAAGAVGTDAAAAMDGSLDRTSLGVPDPKGGPPAAGVQPVSGPRSAAALNVGADGRGQLAQGFDPKSAAPALPSAAAPASAAVPAPSYAQTALAWLGRQWEAFRAAPPARSEEVERLLGKDATASVQAENRLKEDKEAARKAVPALIAALKDDDPVRGRRAASMLLDLGVRRQEDLEALLGVMRGRDARAGGLALAGLVTADPALLRANADAVIAALRPALGPEAPAGRVLAALEVLSALGGTRARDEVVAALGHPDPKVRAKAEAALERIDGKARGGETSPRLRLEDRDRAVRAQALQRLGGMGERGAEAIVSALLGSDRGEALLSDAQQTLTGIGKPAVPELVRALGLLREREEKRWAGTMGRQELLAAGAARDRDLRIALKLAQVLVALDPASAQAAVPWLAKGLEERGTRREALAALERLGAAGLPAFRQALRSGDAGARAETVRDLGRLAKGDALYVAPLAGALADGDPDVRAQALAALAGLGAQGQDAVGALAAVLDSPTETPANRRAALQVLAGLGDGGAAAALAEGLLAKSLGARALDRELGEAVLAALVGMGREDLVARHADALSKKLLEANLRLFIGLREVRREMGRPLDDAEAAALRARWRELTREHAGSLDALAEAAAALGRHRRSELGREVAGYLGQRAGLDAFGKAIRSQNEKVGHMNAIMDDAVRVALALGRFGADNSGENNELAGLGGVGQVPIRTHAKENINSIAWDKAPLLGYLLIANDDSLSTREMVAGYARLGARINDLRAMKDDPAKYEEFARRMPVLQKDLEAYAKRLGKYAQAQDDLSKSFVKLTGMVQSLPLMFAGGMTFPAETTLAANLTTRGGLALFAGTGQAAVDAAAARISPNQGSYGGKEAASSFVEGAMFVGFVPGGAHLLQKLALKGGANSPALRTAITLAGSMVAMQEYGLASDFVQTMIATDGDMSKSLARALGNMKDQAYERALWGLGFAAVGAATTEVQVARNEKAARALGLADPAKATGREVVEALQRKLAEGGPGAAEALKSARVLLAGNEGAAAFLDALEKGAAAPPRAEGRLAGSWGRVRGLFDAAKDWLRGRAEPVPAGGSAAAKPAAPGGAPRVEGQGRPGAPAAPAQRGVPEAYKALGDKTASRLEALHEAWERGQVPAKERQRQYKEFVRELADEAGVVLREKPLGYGEYLSEVRKDVSDLARSFAGAVAQRRPREALANLTYLGKELVAFASQINPPRSGHRVLPDGRLEVFVSPYLDPRGTHYLLVAGAGALLGQPQWGLALAAAEWAGVKLLPGQRGHEYTHAVQSILMEKIRREHFPDVSPGEFQKRVSNAQLQDPVHGKAGTPMMGDAPPTPAQFKVITERLLRDLAGSRSEGARPPEGMAPPPTPLAAARRSLERLVSDLFDGRSGARNGVVDPVAPVRRLEDLGALPSEPGARREFVAGFAGRFLGLTGPVEVRAPPTRPLSGDQVYYVMHGGKLAAVVKVFLGEKGAGTLVSELGAGRAIDGLGLNRSRVVEPRGAFRAGPTETLFVMDPAPGRDVYQAMRSVADAVGAEDRGRALKEASGDVEAVARAMGEIHRVSRSPSVAPETRRFDVQSARERLEGLRARLPDDVYAGLKAHIERLAPAVLAGEGPGALTHGDAHPGNFFVAAGGVTLIDVESAMHSVAPGGGKNGNPAGDVGRFLESLHLNNTAKGFHLAPRELAALDRAFVTAYSAESGIPIAALQKEVDFYRLRLTLTALNGDPARLSHFVDSARGLLRELGPASRGE